MPEEVAEFTIPDDATKEESKQLQVLCAAMMVDSANEEYCAAFQCGINDESHDFQVTIGPRPETP